MIPVISPIWFYIAEVCYNLTIVSILGIFVCSLLILGLIVDRNIDNVKTIRKLSIILMLLIAEVVFIPSKETVYRMMSASIVTQDNINEAQQNPIDFINKVSEAIAQSKK